jgi:hypothetical protein
MAIDRPLYVEFDLVRAFLHGQLQGRNRVLWRCLLVAPVRTGSGGDGLRSW